MTTEMEWHGRPVTDKLRAELNKRLSRAAIHVMKKARKNVSGTPGVSDEGDYPHKQSGHLRRNIAYEVNKFTMTARIGTNVKYGKYLELGTGPWLHSNLYGRGILAVIRMKPRPWLLKTIKNEWGKLRRILAG